MEESLDLNLEYDTGCHIIDCPTEELLERFLTQLEREKCGIFKNAIIASQIGSPSLRATVWLGVFPVKNHLDDYEPISVALKLQHNVQRSEREYQYGLFLANYPENFLLTYNMVKCSNIQTDMEIKSGEFIFMELAQADLWQLLKNMYIKPAVLDGYIIDVMVAVKQMGLSHLYHSDLKIDNVLLVYRNNERRAVIGDFGDTSQSSNPAIVLYDLHYFFQSLLDALDTNAYAKFYEDVGLKIYLMIEYIAKSIDVINASYESWLHPEDIPDPDDVYTNVVRSQGEIDDYMKNSVIYIIDEVFKTWVNL